MSDQCCTCSCHATCDSTVTDRDATVTPPVTPVFPYRFINRFLVYVYLPRIS